MRIVSPEIRFPCDKGVAMPTYQELIANRIPDIHDREDYLGVKSLGHLSVDGLVKSIGIEKNRLCTECLDGHGPHSDRKRAAIPLQESGVLLDNTRGTDIINSE